MSVVESNVDQNIEFKTKFNVQEIKKQVNLIQERIKQFQETGKTDIFEIELDILSEFPEFYDSHSFLVKKICKGDDITLLYKMLENLEMVENGNKSLASVELNLGEQLANKYLYSSMNKK